MPREDKVVPIRPGLEIRPEKLSPVDRLLREHLGTGLKDVVILGVDDAGETVCAYSIDAEPGHVEGRLYQIMSESHRDLVAGKWFDTDTGPT